MHPHSRLVLAAPERFSAWEVLVNLGESSMPLCQDAKAQLGIERLSGNGCWHHDLRPA